MSSEYNSKLIVRLYDASSSSEIERVLDEMVDIADPIFIYPIFKKWQGYNLTTHPISHYFISTLQSINSKEVLKIAIEMFKVSKSLKDIMWLYPIFQKYDYVDGVVINVAEGIIEGIAAQLPAYKTINHFNLSDLLDYLLKVGEIVEAEEALLSIAKQESTEFETRGVALRYAMKINATKIIQFFIDHYKEMQSDDLDILLAKELIRWNGSLTEKLKDIVKQNGNDRARDILNNYQKKQEVELKKDQEKELVRFGNS